MRIIHKDVIKIIKKNLKENGINSIYKKVNNRQYLVIKILENIDTKIVSEIVHFTIPNAITNGNRKKTWYYRLNPKEM